MTFTGTMGTESRGGTLSLAGDISGDDFDGELVVMGQDRVLVRIVDGVAYGRPHGSEWEQIPDYRQTEPINPIPVLGPEDVTYLGENERNGRHVYELEIDKWPGGELQAPGMTNVKLLDFKIKVYVNNRGIPVEAVMDFAISGIAAGYATPFEIDYHVDYKVSQFGKDVTIRAPL